MTEYCTPLSAPTFPRDLQSADPAVLTGGLRSIHLPPPLMMDSTDLLTPATSMLGWSWAICFSAAASSENDHGSMNLASKQAPFSLTKPSSVAAIQRIVRW